MESPSSKAALDRLAAASSAFYKAVQEEVHRQQATITETNATLQEVQKTLSNTKGALEALKSELASKRGILALLGDEDISAEDVKKIKNTYDAYIAAGGEEVLSAAEARCDKEKPVANAYKNTLAGLSLQEGQLVMIEWEGEMYSLLQIADLSPGDDPNLVHCRVVVNLGSTTYVAFGVNTAKSALTVVTKENIISVLQKITKDSNLDKLYEMDSQTLSSSAFKASVPVRTQYGMRVRNDTYDAIRSHRDLSGWAGFNGKRVTMLRDYSRNQDAPPQQACNWSTGGSAAGPSGGHTTHSAAAALQAIGHAGSPHHETREQATEEPEDAVDSDSEEVHICGERSREEKDAELRRHAIDLTE